MNDDQMINLRIKTVHFNHKVIEYSVAFVASEVSIQEVRNLRLLLFPCHPFVIRHYCVSCCNDWLSVFVKINVAQFHLSRFVEMAGNHDPVAT